MVSAPGKRQVLAADDDPDILYVLEELLVSSGYEVITAREGEEALSLALKEKPDIVILDVMMPGMSGLEVVSCLRKEKEFLTIPIILLTSRDQPDDIREGLLVGADDYINKPFRGRELLLRIETACRNRNYYSESIVKRTGGSSKEEVFGDLGIVGKSRAIKGIREQISSISGIDSTVLITGETGVGKEVVASAIHKSSRRRDKPFIVQNVAAVPEQLVESIFFGYKKGAFTGAVSDRQGLFSAANGGTIFLDEIGELSLSSQAVLLRVLESGTYVPVGSSREERVDVRVIAATCRDLKEEVRKGNFREDLYYRLNVINIHIPPLRERKKDIPLLVDYFIKKFNKIYG
ncbi:MAG: sigma-54-dependent Fis family transcriptional regulator, partial [Candidatus Dadabacteria bacterium]